VRFLSSLRELVLGETWTLPLGVAAVLLVGVAAHALVPQLWQDVGGLVLLAGVIAVLSTSIARGSAGR
jgi:hypothetical protein